MRKEIPVGWAWASFSEVARIAADLVDPLRWPDLPHIAPDNIERHTGKLLPYEPVREDRVKSSNHRFYSGQLLYSKIRPYLNKCIRVDFDGLCSADMYPVDAFISEKFLHYFMLTRQFVSAVSTAAGSRTILPKTNQAQMAALPVPVAPLPEQNRIVDALDSYLTRLDDAVASLKQAQAKLKAYRASVLKAAVEGRLVPTEAALARAEKRDYEAADVLLARILKERHRRWEDAELARLKKARKTPKDGKCKTKYEQPVEPDTTTLPGLPEGWGWATIEQLASDEARSIQSGPFGSNLLHSEFQHEGRLVVGIDNVQDGCFSIGAEHRISEKKFRELEHYRARGGDVLITVMATVGRTCVIPNDLEPAIITKHIYRITPNREAVQPHYLHLALWGAPAVREQMFGQVIGQTRPGLNGGIIRKLAIPIPPMSEQIRIVEAAERSLSFRDQAANGLVATNLKVLRLRQSVLKWAFEGKLVDQDPNDEPAEKLLARIGSAHAAAVPPKEANGRRRRGAA